MRSVVELTSFSGSFAALFDSELGFDGADEVGFSALLGANVPRLCCPVLGITRGLCIRVAIVQSWRELKPGSNQKGYGFIKVEAFLTWESGKQQAGTCDGLGHWESGTLYIWEAKSCHI